MGNCHWIIWFSSFSKQTPLEISSSHARTSSSTYDEIHHTTRTNAWKSNLQLQLATIIINRLSAALSTRSWVVVDIHSKRVFHLMCEHTELDWIWKTAFCSAFAESRLNKYFWMNENVNSNTTSASFFLSPALCAFFSTFLFRFCASFHN